MIVRIVKLNLQADQLEKFMEHFTAVRKNIRSFPGCTSLELLRDAAMPHTLFTWSHWESESALNNYLNSDLFRSTWNRVRPLFEAKATAWSMIKMDELGV